MFKVTNFMVIGHKVIVEFNNQKHRVLDFKKAYKDYLDTPVIEELLNNYELFRNVRIEGDTLEWPNGFDVDPEMLFEISHSIDASYFKFQ